MDQGLYAFIIIIVSLIVLVSTLAIIAKCIKNASYKFVKQNSVKFRSVLELNKNTEFIPLRTLRLSFSCNLDSRRKFMNFNYDKRVNEYIKDNKALFSKYILVSDKNSQSYKYYLLSVNEIKSKPTCFTFKLPFYLNQQNFLKIEDTIIKDAMIVPDVDFYLVVTWSYTSPAGRIHLDDKAIIKRKELIKKYQQIFYNIRNEDTQDKELNLSKSSEQKRNVSASETRYGSCYDDLIERYNPYTEEELKIMSLIPSLDKKAYSKKQLKELLLSLGITASDVNINFLICEADLKKQKRVDVYVKKQFGTIDNAILCSANDNGIIFYDNIIKGIEYDYAIDRLCKERRIIPISNMAFLKNDSSISFDGMTVSDINYFDFLVKNLAATTNYISAKYVKDKIECKIIEAEYDECFVYNLLKYCGFLTEVSNIKGLFSFNGSKERIDFLMYMIGTNKSIDAFNLIYDIKDMYGVEYNIYSIVYDINKSNSGLYYNEETEKIYINKDIFYEEVL